MPELEIYATSLSKRKFSTFGQVIQADGSSSFWINDNKCERFDALAEIDVTFSTGSPVISIFRSKLMKDVWFSGEGVSISLERMMGEIDEYVKDGGKIFIGTDSQLKSDGCVFVAAPRCISKSG